MRNLKRKLALLLAIVMVVGMLPMHVFGRGTVMPVLLNPIMNHGQAVGEHPQRRAHDVEVTFNLRDLGAVSLGTTEQPHGDLFLEFIISGGNTSMDVDNGAVFFAPLDQSVARAGNSPAAPAWNSNMWPAWGPPPGPSPNNPSTPNWHQNSWAGQATQMLTPTARGTTGRGMVEFSVHGVGGPGSRTPAQVDGYRFAAWLNADNTDPDNWVPRNSQILWDNQVDPGSTYRRFLVPLNGYAAAVRAGFHTGPNETVEGTPAGTEDDPFYTPDALDPGNTPGTFAYSLPFALGDDVDGSGVGPTVPRFAAADRSVGGASPHNLNFALPAQIDLTHFMVNAEDNDTFGFNASEEPGSPPAFLTAANVTIPSGWNIGHADANDSTEVLMQWFNAADRNQLPAPTAARFRMGIRDALSMTSGDPPGPTDGWNDGNNQFTSFAFEWVPASHGGNQDNPPDDVPADSTFTGIQERLIDTFDGGGSFDATNIITGRHTFTLERRHWVNGDYIGTEVFEFHWEAATLTASDWVANPSTGTEDDPFTWEGTPIINVDPGEETNVWRYERTWTGAPKTEGERDEPGLPMTPGSPIMPNMDGQLTATIGVVAGHRDATVSVNLVRLVNNAFSQVSNLVDSQRLVHDDVSPGVSIELHGSPAHMTATHARIPRINITELEPGQLSPLGSSSTVHDIRLTAPRGFRWDLNGVGAAVGGGRFGIERGPNGFGDNVWEAGAAPRWWLLPPVWGPATDRDSINPTTRQDELHLRIQLGARRTDTQARTTNGQIRLMNLWLIANLDAPSTDEVRIAVEFGQYSFDMGRNWVNPNAPGFLRRWHPDNGRPLDWDTDLGSAPDGYNPVLPSTVPAWVTTGTTALVIPTGTTPPTDNSAFGTSPPVVPNTTTDLYWSGRRDTAVWANMNLHVANMGDANVRVIGPAEGRFGGIAGTNPQGGRSGTTNFADPQRYSLTTSTGIQGGSHDPAVDGILVGGLPGNWLPPGDAPGWLNRNAPTVRIQEIASGTMRRAAIEGYSIVLTHPGVRFVDVQVSETIGQAYNATGPDGRWGTQVPHLTGRRGMTHDTFYITPTPVDPDPQGRLRSLDFRFQISVEPGAATRYGSEVEVRVYRDDTLLDTVVIAEIYDPIAVAASDPLVLERDLFDALPLTQVAPISFTEAYAGLLRPGDEIWVYMQATSGGIPIIDPMGGMNLHIFTPPTVNTGESGLALRQLTPTAVALGTASPPVMGYRFEVMSPSRDDVPGTITFADLRVIGSLTVGIDHHVVFGGPVIAPNSHLNLAQPPRNTAMRDYLVNTRWIGMPYSATVVSVTGTHAAEDTHPGIQPELPGVTPPGVRPIAPRPAQRYERNAFMSVLFDTAWYEIRPVINHPSIDGVTLLANRVFAQFIDADIHWNDARREVTVVGYNATGERTVVAVIVNEPWATVNGVNVDIARFSLDMTNPINERLVGRITPLIVDDATYLPLRFMATAFGMDLDRLWNENDPDAITLSW